MSKNKNNLKPSRISIFFLLLSISVIFSLASAEVLLWSDDMTNFPTNWTVGGTGGPWTQVSTRHNSAPYSAKCTPNNNYSNDQNNWMERSINLTGYENAWVVFYIWQKTEADDYIYFEYLSGGNWITYWARAGDYGSFTQQVMANIPNTASAIRFRFASDSSDSNEGVYIDDISVFGFRYDVGCTQIIAPTGIYDSGQTVTPQAQVENFGDFVSTFFIRLGIGTFYDDSVQVSDLPPGGTSIINFTDWTVLQRGIQTVRCSTELPNDIDLTNDRTTCSTEVKIKNVGTVSIITPTGTVDSSQVITPRALIKNYGTTTETFTVYYWISPGYLSSRSRTLGPGVAETTNFDPWTALSRGTQTTRCSTALTGDMVLDDNRKTGSIMVRVRDVGTTMILTPTGLVDSTATLTPQAKIKNYGTNQENLTVNFRITGPNNWSNAASVLSLNPNEERTISFSAWNIGPRGNYTTRCSTALTGDQISANNKLDSSFVVRVHDVGVVSISSPPASVDSNSTVSVTATVQNFGTESENFSVLFRINSFYTSNRTVTLTPGGSQLVTFDNWAVNQPRSTYTARCTTILASDAKPSNNRQTRSVSVNVHDVGVAAINSPPSQVDTNTITPVSAQIRNYGTYSETFNVVFKISAFYTSTRTLTLAAGNASIVTFDNWTVTQVRGSYVTKCSTALGSDINPNNNYRVGSVAVRVLDAGVVVINSPPSPVDTNTLIPVSAQITNYGSNPETFNVVFKISDFYTSIRTLTLAAGNASMVTFDTWTVSQPRGTYTMKCSTALGSDVNPNNDYRVGSVTIRVHDVGTVTINSPALVDSTDSVPIGAVIMNYGTEPETFTTLFRIGSFYSSTRTTTLNPNTSNAVTFDTWIVTQPRGNYATKCSTLLSNDARHDNDYQNGSIGIRLHDVCLKHFSALPQAVDSGTPLTIIANVANLGSYSENFTVRCAIGFDYNCTRQITLPPNETTLVAFDPWTPLVRNNNTVVCTTELSNDVNHLNDKQTDTIFVVVRDIWASEILAPIDTITLGRTIIPKTRLENLGNLPASFPVWFKITRDVMPVYYDTMIINLGPGTTTDFDFRNWQPESLGTHFTETHCRLSADMNPANDIKYGEVLIQSYTAWFQKNDLPKGSGKKVKQGGALVYVPTNTVYGLKGSNTNEFFRYNISTDLSACNAQADTWTQVCSMPNSAKPKKVKNGATLGYGQGYIYALKGSSTFEFWRYTPTVDSWYEKKPVPIGLDNRKVKNGTGLTYITKGDTNFVYCLKGSKTNEFYAYWVEMDTWLERKPVPTSRKPMGAGSCIAYDGTNTIYALQGKTNEFFAYNVLADTWSVKPMMPFIGSMNKKKKTKDGAAMASNGAGLVYAFKGANTNEFWAYATTEDTWLIKEPIPEGIFRKRVKAGGSLCYVNSLDRLYGFKGGNTNEFWMYTPYTTPVADKGTLQSGTMANSIVPPNSHTTLNIIPNPFAKTAMIKYELAEPDDVTLKLYDVSGKLVQIVTRQTNSKTGTMILDGEKLPVGIYILRLETHNQSRAKKIIVNH